MQNGRNVGYGRLYIERVVWSLKITYLYLLALEFLITLCRKQFALSVQEQVIIKKHGTSISKNKKSLSCSNQSN